MARLPLEAARHVEPAVSAQMPSLLQDAGVPLDLFIQALTEQLDKAQASMAIKARVGKMPLTFAVKDVSIDIRAFVQMIDDDVYLRPAGPGESEASTIKLALTTITKAMVEENAVDFKAEDAEVQPQGGAGRRDIGRRPAATGTHRRAHRAPAQRAQGHRGRRRDRAARRGCPSTACNRR